MSDNYKTISFIADTIDGRILEFPKQFYLRCSFIRPQQVQVVRNYTGTECIEAITVFLIYYDGQLLGSKCWKSFDSFMRFYRAACQGQGTCNLLVNGNLLQLNGCNLTIKQ